jgi:hypothetical protein
MEDDSTRPERRRRDQQQEGSTGHAHQASGLAQTNESDSTSARNSQAQRHLARAIPTHPATAPTGSASYHAPATSVRSTRTAPSRPTTASTEAAAQVPLNITTRPAGPVTRSRGALAEVHSSALPKSARPATTSTGGPAQTRPGTSARPLRLEAASTEARLQVPSAGLAVPQTALQATTCAESASRYPPVRDGIGLIPEGGPRDRPPGASGGQRQPGEGTQAAPSNTNPFRGTREASAVSSPLTRGLPIRSTQWQESPGASSSRGRPQGERTLESSTSPPHGPGASRSSTRPPQGRGDSRPATTTAAAGKRTDFPTISPEDQGAPGPSKRPRYNTGPFVESVLSLYPRVRMIKIRIETGFMLAAKNAQHASASVKSFAEILAANYNSQNPGVPIGLWHDDDSKWVLRQNTDVHSVYVDQASHSPCKSHSDSQ